MISGDGCTDWCDTKGAVVINGKTLLKIYNKYGYDTGEALKKFVSFGWVKELKNPFEYETTKGSQGHINHDLRTNFRYSDEPYAYDIYNSDYQYPFDDVDCYLRPYEDVCIRDMNRIRVEIGDFEQTVKAAGSHG